MYSIKEKAKGIHKNRGKQKHIIEIETYSLLNTSNF